VFIYFDEPLLNLKLLKTENFFTLPVLTGLALSDDTYETFRNFPTLTSFTKNIFFSNTQLFDTFQSYLLVTNAFRSDYEELT